MKNMGFIAFVGIFLNACAPITYTLGGQTYPTASAALSVQRSQMDAILLKVDPAVTRYAGRAIVLIPSDGDIRARGVVRTGTPAPEVEDYVAAVNHRALAFFREVIAKRNMFESVEVRDVNGTARPEISTGEHGIWAQVIGPGQSSWKYFTPAMAAPVSILIDSSLPRGGPIYVDWLDRLNKVVAGNGGLASTGASSSGRAAPGGGGSVTRTSTGSSAGKIKRTLD